MAFLEVKNLSFKYQGSDKNSLNNISFSVEQGEFVLICGASGSGKSTLLRMLKSEISPLGETTGEITFDYQGIDKAEFYDIGFVMQNPNEQIVTDKVYSELAFALESMGLDNKIMARRIGEMASYFGIEDWYMLDTANLSGGQKQMLNLASAMVTSPRLLILDEPTSQLDPIAASEFISTLKKLNKDLSLTVIIVEHRLDELLEISDKLIMLENGSLIYDGKPRDVFLNIDKSNKMMLSMPSASRLYLEFENKNSICPLSVNEGRNFIRENFENKINKLDFEYKKCENKTAIEFSSVYYRYEKELPDVLKDLNFKVYEGEIFCLLGGNGSGKSTTLNCASGILKPYSGKIRIFGKNISEYKNMTLYKNCVSKLAQDVETMFLRNTVKEELEDANTTLTLFENELSSKLSMHPYDLSGGEKQMLAFEKVLATKPRILLADEPTKGLDAEKKQILISTFKRLKSEGITVMIVTHDVEFAAECADRCALCFNGRIIGEDEKHKFFSENYFYTTAINKMTKGYYEGAVTLSDALDIIKKNMGEI